MVEKQPQPGEISIIIKKEEFITNKQNGNMSKEIGKATILNISKIILGFTIIIIDIILVSQP